jgi:hypothetical protein
MNDQEIFEFLKKNLKFTVKDHWSYDDDTRYCDFVLSLTNPATGQDEVIASENLSIYNQ